MMPGGVDRYILDLAGAARASGYEVSVLIERSSGNALGPALEENGIETHRCRLYHRSYDDDVIARECLDVLRRAAPDLLHVVCGIPWSCLTLRETAAARGLATVVTEQYVPEGLELSPAVSARIETLYGASRQVIFVSAGNRNEMERRVRFDAARACVIPNAVGVGEIRARCPSPQSRLERAKERRSAGSLRVMTAARLAPQKGVDLLIAAAAALGADAGMRFDLYGEGPERESLEERCRELGLSRTVRFHGWCGDVPGELAEHDLF
ncbi:MAG TPA: glycosyltransferase, partial [Thermoanaerobaculia bacterium]|nr:glycosyltransferase [Thermoanaerobaculia bacterium]